ncbi:MAG TPA: hypothetical protein VLK85_07910 [Ramlibacter sp.]|nr:hypothetical protein [Ramlibacter sp.]
MNARSTRRREIGLPDAKVAKISQKAQKKPIFNGCSFATFA